MKFGLAAKFDTFGTIATDNKDRRTTCQGNLIGTTHVVVDMRYSIATLLVLALHTLQAQAQATWLDRVDSMLKKNYFDVDIDTAYIIRPRQRWSLRFSQNIAGTGIEAESHIDGLQQVTHLEAELRTTFTLGIRYSGLALALSVNPAHLKGKNNDIELNMNAYGNRYGIDLIGLSTRTLAGTITTDNSHSNIAAGQVHQQALYANAYYALNRRRFSYPAAFSQSYIQKASAGSWLLGLSYFYTRVTTEQGSSLANAPSQLILHNVGIGGGYAYNWVPARRWLLHLSALPTFVVYI